MRAGRVQEPNIERIECSREVSKGQILNGLAKKFATKSASVEAFVLFCFS